MKTKRYSSMLIVLAIAALGAGCGGDDDTTSSTTASSTTTTGTSGASGAEGSTVAAVNAVCKETDKAIDAAFSDAFGGEEPSGPPDAAESKTLADTVTPVIEDALKQIEAVPGATDDSAVTAFVDAARSDLDQINSDPEAAFQGGNPFKATNQAAKDGGLDECA